MRPPTGNEITQKMHGSYNAVDYAAWPDVFIYAPEDMTFYAYLENAGAAGNNLQMTGDHGRHGFCHLEEMYIDFLGRVKKGELIGKMGYTGLTDPPGPEGRHLHWVIRQDDGTYVYPPSLVTEPFGEEFMQKKDEVRSFTTTPKERDDTINQIRLLAGLPKSDLDWLLEMFRPLLENNYKDGVMTMLDIIIKSDDAAINQDASKKLRQITEILAKKD